MAGSLDGKIWRRFSSRNYPAWFTNYKKEDTKGKYYEKIADEMEIKDYSCFNELFTLVKNYPNYSAKELIKVYLKNQ